MIVKTKQFAVKPMTPRRPFSSSSSIGHDFFVFRNGDTERDQRRLPPARRRLRPDRAELGAVPVPAARAAPRAARPRGRARPAEPLPEAGPPGWMETRHPRRPARSANGTRSSRSRRRESTGDRGALRRGCADDTLVIEEGGDVEPLAAALDAVGATPPYRAEAVRAGRVPVGRRACARIQVVELPDDPEATRSTLTVRDGERDARSSTASRVFGVDPALEQLGAARGADYVVQARRARRLAVARSRGPASGASQRLPWVPGMAGQDSALSRRFSASARAGASSGSRSRRRTSPRSSPTSRSSPTTSCAARPPSSAQRLENGEALEELLFEAFAAVREARLRESDQRIFDVQLMGGIVLHEGDIAEMKTGEGKTFVASLALYLNALPGKGVHLVTVNDYLAKRDAEWNGGVFERLGMTVGWIENMMPFSERKAAYDCDVTYGTNSEFGFDYLRDNMAVSLEQCVQRGHSYAIVDEVDSILVDEARTPLIISGEPETAAKVYVRLRARRQDAEGDGAAEGQAGRFRGDPAGDRLLLRREVQDGRADRVGDREGRARARDREPLRPAERPARQPPEPGAEGAGAVPARRRLRRRRTTR